MLKNVMQQNQHDLVLLISKVISIIILFTITLIVGYYPYKIENFKPNRPLLSASAALAGGLYLGVSLLQLLPESTVHMETINIDIKNEKFPWPQSIVIIVFMFNLLCEKVGVAGLEQIGYDVKSHLGSFRDFQEVDQEQLFKDSISSRVNLAKLMGIFTKKRNSRISSSEQLIRKEEVVPSWAAHALQFFLGVHSIMIGLCLGLENQISNTWILTFAIFCEKICTALQIGTSFKKAEVSKNIAIRVLLIQGILEPLGIGIGWAAENVSENYIGMIQAISAGAFLYQSTMNILVEEFSISRYKISKFILFLFAIGIVSGLWEVEQEYY